MASVGRPRVGGAGLGTWGRPPLPCLRAVPEPRLPVMERRATRRLCVGDSPATSYRCRPPGAVARMAGRSDR